MANREENVSVRLEPAPAASAEPQGASPTLHAAPAMPRWAVIGIFLILFVASLSYARNFLMPVVLAFLLALVFSPVRRFLERRGIPAWLSGIAIVCSLLAALLVGVLLLAAPVQQSISEGPAIVRELEWKMRALFGSAMEMLRAGQEVEEVAGGGSDDDVQEVVLRERGLFASVALVAPAYLAQAVFTLVLLFFLLSSGDMFYEKIVNVMPTFGDRRQAMRIAYDIERKLSRYLFTITLINAGLGVAIGIAMMLLGMPNPLLFGVIAFALNFVPYLGALAGVAIAFVVGLLSFPEPGSALLAALVYFALTSTEGQLVTPYFVGRRLEMNTVVIFISITFWAWLWSVMGMLLAVPLLVTIRAFCEHIPELEPIGKFLAARGSESNGLKGESPTRAPGGPPGV